MKSQLRPRVLLPFAVVALLGLGVSAFAFTGTPGGDAGPPALQRPAKKNKQASAASTATRSEWVKAASAICRDLNEEAAALGTPQSQAEMLTMLPLALDLADRALVDLRAVPAPKRDAAEINRMLAFFDRFAKLERKAVAALGREDVEEFARLNGQAFALNDRGNAIARRLGARECAEGGSDDTELARELDRHRVVVAVLYSPGSTVDRLAIREARAGANDVGAGFVTIDVYDAKEVGPVAAQYAGRGAPAVLVFTRTGGAVTAIEGYADRETVAQAADNAAAV